MEIIKTLTVYLVTRNESVIIDVNCQYDIDNTGIGYYDFCGQLRHDAGVNYAEITDTSWDQEGFTDLEIDDIEDKIESSKEEWAAEIDVENVQSID